MELKDLFGLIIAVATYTAGIRFLIIKKAFHHPHDTETARQHRSNLWAQAAILALAAYISLFTIFSAFLGWATAAKCLLATNVLLLFIAHLVSDIGLKDLYCLACACKHGKSGNSAGDQAAPPDGNAVPTKSEPPERTGG